jgi:magnesium chelatase subunit D
MALTRSRLEEMPCGGGSPLAHALTTAIRTGMNEIKVKKDVGRAVVVLLTDGRANIPLSVSEGEIDAYSPEMPSRAYMKEEAIAVAKTLGSLQDFDIVVVDTEDKFVGTGIARDIAKASQGLYQALLHSDAASVSNLAREAVESSRVPSK